MYPYRRRVVTIPATLITATVFLAVIVAVAIAERMLGVDRNALERQQVMRSEVQVPAEAELQSLDRATGWLNSPPLAAPDLRGKVVLVDFWTYSCINWIRSLPYIRAWAERYREQGLVVIGVHSPEFAFEHNLENVRQAAKQMRVEYPIAVDNDFSIWRAFNNAAWPALYLIDARGEVRFRHFGEGEYERSERMIQRLLAEAGARDVSRKLAPVVADGVEADADWGNLRSPENYLGYDRTQHFASPGGASLETRRTYQAPPRLQLNQWALSGDWTFGRQATRLNLANGRIVNRFHARDLHLVMGPAARGRAVRFRVLIDGRPPGAAHGLDVDEQGNGMAREQRMYQLIRQRKPITDRQFEIEFLDPGVDVFSFTFG